MLYLNLLLIDLFRVSWNRYWPSQILHFLILEMIKPRYFILLLILSVAFASCHNCDKFEKEGYSEADTLTLNSPYLSSIKKYYSDLKQHDLEGMGKSSYRLFCRHAFQDYQKIIQFSKSESGCVLTCITVGQEEVDGTWNTVVIDSTIKNFPISKWDEFDNLVYRSNFWTLPQPINEKGLDGRTIVLEGYRPEACSCDKRAYHLIVRWSPEPGFLSDVCDSLLSYADCLDSYDDK